MLEEPLTDGCQIQDKGGTQGGHLPRLLNCEESHILQFYLTICIFPCFVVCWEQYGGSGILAHMQ